MEIDNAVADKVTRLTDKQKAADELYEALYEACCPFCHMPYSLSPMESASIPCESAKHRDVYAALRKARGEA
jgi:hypothetical protein